MGRGRADLRDTCSVLSYNSGSLPVPSGREFHPFMLLNGSLEQNSRRLTTAQIVYGCYQLLTAPAARSDAAGETSPPAAVYIHLCLAQTIGAVTAGLTDPCRTGEGR